MFGHGLVALLCLLVVIHVYWFSIIVKIAYRKIMTGVVEDVRETEATNPQAKAGHQE